LRLKDEKLRGEWQDTARVVVSANVIKTELGVTRTNDQVRLAMTCGIA
jgi:hypothetical protein